MAYGFSRAVTIDHTKCGSSNSTNFPMLFSGTYTYLKTVGNGGNVQNSNGFDIAFFSDAGLTTALSWEVEAYNAATGAIIAWVKIPTLSSGSDTVVYLAYGDSGVSTFQGGSTGAAFDSNYVEVHHFGDGTTLSLSDSTSNTNTATNHSAAAISGKIGGAADLTGGGGSYTLGAWRGAWVESPVTDITFSGANSGSIELWVNPQYAYNDGKIYEIFGATNNAATAFFTGFWHYSDGNWYLGWQGGSDYRVIVAASSVNEPQNTWSHVVLVWNSGTAAKVYMNGALAGTAGASTSVSNLGVTLGIGGDHYTGGTNTFLGYLDEFRLSKSVRSADWVLSSYNSQNAPSTFYSIGAAGGATTHPSTGALVGQGSTVAGTAVRFRAHPSSGAIVGPGAVVAGTAAHTGLAHATSGALVGQGALVVGAATRFTVHPTSGALTGPGALVVGTANRTKFHPSSGVLTGQGSTLAGIAVHTVFVPSTHTTTGVLIAQGAIITGVAQGKIWTPVPPTSTTWTPATLSTTVWTPQ